MRRRNGGLSYIWYMFAKVLATPLTPYFIILIELFPYVSFILVLRFLKRKIMEKDPF